MAVKKSRTGKKKKPQYGPQGTKTHEGPAPTAEQVRAYKNAKRANYGSIGLLIVAMILLLVAPSSEGAAAWISIFAYILTIISGALIHYTSKYVVPERLKMTRITSTVLIVVGAVGLAMTCISLRA